jgi:hypothetical protein
MRPAQVVHLLATVNYLEIFLYAVMWLQRPTIAEDVSAKLY